MRSTDATTVGFLFEGLPLGWQIYFTAALCLVVAMFLWTFVLFVRSGRDVAPADSTNADHFHWVFIVPALNEETTIADSVSRLLQVDVRHRRILVVDDGSDDHTPDVLAGIDHPDLVVLRRDPPNARIGKAAALNDAYRTLDLGDVARDRVIVAIVDADGRISSDGPRYVAGHFADPGVGGVQSRVRIYNRQRVLTWMQDVEFGVYGHLFQAGRNHWGTAGMGGNGQYNRLSALDDVADEVGPWRDRLTEDQDLGLRLFAAGWRGRQELRATVDQQGLSHLRPLLRQRTRWSQGNLQAIRLAGTVWRARFPLAARFEQLAYLMMPFIQGFIGVALVAAAVLAITGVAPLWGGGPTWHLVVMYLLAFGGTVLGAVAARRGRGPVGWLVGFAVGHAYAFYTWLIWPVLVRSTARQLRQRSDWAKTAREPIAAVSPTDLAA